ncbi:MAG: hypothetical protein ACYSW7_06035 [Planctomycetota bacterium]|jgi:hypothetical protein
MNEFEIREIAVNSIERYLEERSILTKFWQLSGRYKYKATAIVRETERILDKPLAEPFDKPLHVIGNMPYAEQIPPEMLPRFNFTLHIDIDGTDPLNVVSGTVTRYCEIYGSSTSRFIGQVTSNTTSGLEYNLVVENFSFNWPRTSNVLDRLEISFSGFTIGKHVAQVVFIDTARNKRYGPYVAEQESIYFRDVEVEIDREDDAVDVEPYNTHTHPDRPADIPVEDLTIEKAFAKAGIKITRSSESNIISTEEAPDGTWSYRELHDAMEDHWSAFADKPQWKMWIFLAELAERDGLGGAMFDAGIEELGGVDRQGTAIFTKCPEFYTPGGDFIVDNPPVDEAVARQLFVHFIHETGHAFNLAHSWRKHASVAWTPPDWMPLASNARAPSWMNYAWLATWDAQGIPNPLDYNSTWFYDRFRFKFIPDELLFLRHAPASYVQMGNEAWFQNHAVVAPDTLNHRLELVVRNRKKIVELGEPVFVELRLRNVGRKPVRVHANLDPADGLVELAVTDPQGRRRPFIPFIRTSAVVQHQNLEPGKSVYGSVNLTVGMFGFPFKEPGRYIIEASYRNIPGGTAAATMDLWVRPPADYDDMPVINELFNARVGRVLYVGGTRLMEDVNDKIDWVCSKLGKAHPARLYLKAVRGLPLVNPHKILRADSKKLRLLDPEPDKAVKTLSPMIENMAVAADSIGHIDLRSLVDSYSEAAVAADKIPHARKAMENLLAMFKKRHVPESVTESIERRVRELT